MGVVKSVFVSDILISFNMKLQGEGKFMLQINNIRICFLY